MLIATCESAAPESSAGYAAAARSAPRSLLLGGEQVPAVAVLQAFAKRAKSVVPRLVVSPSLAGPCRPQPDEPLLWRAPFLSDRCPTWIADLGGEESGDTGAQELHG